MSDALTDAYAGAGGACARHGLYDGRRCPGCAESQWPEGTKKVPSTTARGRIAALEADLAAARRENATLREALERIAEAEDWVDVEDCQAEARAALVAPAAEEPQP